MTIFLFLTGLLLSLILIYYNYQKYPSAIYLGLFFFLISLYSLIYEVILNSKSVFLISIVYQNFGFPTYLIGPALYFYIRSVLSDNSSLRKWDLLHLIPALLFLLAVLPYTFTSFSYKLDVARQIAQNARDLEIIKPTLLYRMLPAEVIYLSRPVHVLIYLLWSMEMIVRFIWRGQDSLVMKHQRYMIRWLIVLISFTLIVVVLHLLQVHEAFALQMRLFYTMNLLHLFAGISLTALIISPFFFPRILYGLPRFMQPEESVKQTNSLYFAQKPATWETAAPESGTTGQGAILPVASDTHAMTTGPALPEKRKQAHTFEADYLSSVRFKVLRCMEEEKPYLQQGCNLAFLSRLIDIPAHHLAYFFREEIKQSFNDFRNEWRVNHAKNMIRNGKARELTLEAIGLSSGFSSRITFINIFKKVEGITPGSYASKYNTDPS